MILINNENKHLLINADNVIMYDSFDDIVRLEFKLGIVYENDRKTELEYTRELDNRIIECINQEDKYVLITTERYSSLPSYLSLPTLIPRNSIKTIPSYTNLIFLNNSRTYLFIPPEGITFNLRITKNTDLSNYSPVYNLSHFLSPFPIDDITFPFTLDNVYTCVYFADTYTPLFQNKYPHTREEVDERAKLLQNPIPTSLILKMCKLNKNILLIKKDIIMSKKPTLDYEIYAKIIKRTMSLETGEKATYYVPFLNEVLFREGTIGEGSCFFHSFLTDTDEAYREGKDKSKRVKVFRRELRKKATPEKIKEYLGETLLMKFNTKFKEYILSYYKFIRKAWKGEQLLDELLRNELVMSTKMIQQIKLGQIFNALISPPNREKGEEVKDYDSYIQTFFNRIEHIDTWETLHIPSRILDPPENVYLKLENSDVIENKEVTDELKLFARNIVEIIKDHIESEVITEIQQKIEEVCSWADEAFLRLVCELLDYNILFIDNSTRMPYRSGLPFDPNKKSVFIIWKSHSHFEACGILNERGKVDRYVLEAGDPIVVKFNDLVSLSKGELIEKYPELTEFIEHAYFGVKKEEEESEEEEEEEEDET